MSNQPANATWTIWLTLLGALMLTIWPLPEAVTPFRPEWTALALIYWIMAMPHRVNVGTAWFVGLIADVLTGSVLGQHALALAVVAVLVTGIHLRMRVFPISQQMIPVMALLAVHEVLLILVEGSTGRLYNLEWRWAPVLIGMLFWPWVLFLLRFIRRHFDVT